MHSIHSHSPVTHWQVDVDLIAATKIEFFVGDVVDDAPMFQEEARYARLGFVMFIGLLTSLWLVMTGRWVYAHKLSLTGFIYFANSAVVWGWLIW